jgi:hypothetical protein
MFSGSPSKTDLLHGVKWGKTYPASERRDTQAVPDSRRRDRSGRKEFD